MTKNTGKAIQVTKQGLDELNAELAELVEVKLPAVIKRVGIARSHGDLSENAEYQNAREDQQLVEARIAEIENIISHATVVKSTTSTTKVGIGSVVTVSLKTSKTKKFTYHIVGEFEANPQEGKISSDSPLGRALMGKKKGDEATVKAPAGEVVYLIAEIK